MGAETTLMPSSFIDSVAPIVHTIVAAAPKRVLDVGPGWGKYGLLCREYLHDLTWLDAIEVPEGRKPSQDLIYDRLYEGDVRDLKSRALWAAYDLVLMIDIIEHLPKDDGHNVLASVVDAGTAVLISTPKLFVEQHDPDNPHEEHLCVWEWSDFQRYDIRTDASTIDSIIYVLGAKTPNEEE